MDQFSSIRRVSGLWRFQRAAVVLALALSLPVLAFAQAGEGATSSMPEQAAQAGCQCPMSGMHGLMGGSAMALGGLLVLAIIFVLVALAMFLIRRSRPRPPASA